MSAAYPDPAAPAVIAAAARTAAELGAHMVKTSMPNSPEAMRDVAACGIPVILAGGDFEPDGRGLLDDVAHALAAGAAGVAHGRNVWGRDDPGAAVSALRDVVHPERRGDDRWLTASHSSPAPAAGSAGQRRSRWRARARECWPWLAVPKRWSSLLTRRKSSRSCPRSTPPNGARG